MPATPPVQLDETLLGATVSLKTCALPCSGPQAGFESAGRRVCHDTLCSRSIAALPAGSMRQHTPRSLQDFSFLVPSFTSHMRH
eukprot:1142036-Pleurochrysis_carterae.AAC.2